MEQTMVERAVDWRHEYSESPDDAYSKVDIVMSAPRGGQPTGTDR